MFCSSRAANVSVVTEKSIFFPSFTFLISSMIFSSENSPRLSAIFLVPPRFSRIFSRSGSLVNFTSTIFSPIFSMDFSPKTATSSASEMSSFLPRKKMYFFILGVSILAVFFFGYCIGLNGFFARNHFDFQFTQKDINADFP